MLSETKLGLEDPTPDIPGIGVKRNDRKGSGTKSHRCGGILDYVSNGTMPYLWQRSPTASPGEMQQICIPQPSSHTAMHHRTVKFNYAGSAFNLSHRLNQLLTTNGLMFGDFITRQIAWDEFAKADRRGLAIYNGVDDNDKDILNYGRPTETSKHNQHRRTQHSDLSIA